MGLDCIMKESQAIAELERHLKRRAMVFQVSKKEHIARQMGLPIESFYDLPHREWVQIRDNFKSGAQV